jgi:biopolymer transport protein ExbD
MVQFSSRLKRVFMRGILLTMGVVFLLLCFYFINNFVNNRSEQSTFTTADLPSFRNFSGYGHVDIPFAVHVTVLDNKSYDINGWGCITITNYALLSRRLSLLLTPAMERRLLIQARAEAPFADVWEVVEASFKNARGFLFAVKIRESEEEETFQSAISSWFSKKQDIQDLIMFNRSASTNVWLKEQTVFCRSDGICVEQKVLPVEQFGIWLSRVRRYNLDKRVFIWVAPDCPYQKVIRVIEECYLNYIQFSLGLESDVSKENSIALDIRLIGQGAK